MFEKEKETKKQIIEQNDDNEESINELELDISSKKISDEDNLDLDIDLDIDLDEDMIDLQENDIDISDDFIDLDDANEEPEVIKKISEQSNEENSNNENDITSMNKITIRNYMKNLRKRDKKLYDYETSIQYKNYSGKCGAVDMRQPCQ